MPTKLSAVIIAGHDRRPMKTPKQTLPFGDTTVLNRTLGAYLDAGFDKIVLVLGEHADEIRDALGPLAKKVKVEVVSNPEAEGIGPHLRLGVESLGSSAKDFAIGMSDQPLLTTELLKDLMERFRGSDKKILVPVCQDAIGHPSFFDASMAAEIAKLPDQGELWDILKSHSDEIEDHHIYHTAVIHGIEDMDDYHHLLELAGLPIPEPVGKPEEEEEAPVEAKAKVDETETAPPADPAPNLSE